MPRPQTKNDLIEAADLNYDKFLKLIDFLLKISEYNYQRDDCNISLSKIL